MSDKILNKIIGRVPKWQKIYHRLSMDIAQHINELIKKEGGSQADLAEMLGKHESEISKWLSGNHNFTLKSLAKLEDMLESRIIFVPIEFQGYILKPEGKYTTNVGSAERDEAEKIYDVEEDNVNKKTITLKNKALRVLDAA